MGTETGAIFKTLWAGNFQYFLAVFLAFQILLFNDKKRKYYWILMPLFAIAGIGFKWIPRIKLFNIGIDGFICVITVFIMGILLFKESIPTLLCVTAMSMAFQSIVWNFAIMIFDWIPDSGSLTKPVVLVIWYCLSLLFFGGLFLFMFLKKIEYRWKKKDAVSLIGGTILLLVSYILFQINRNWNAIVRIFVWLLNTIGIALEILIPHAIEATEKARAYKDEKANLEALLSLQSHQNELSKQEQEILNMRLHDFRNQLNTLRSLEGDKSKEGLAELEKSMDVYGAYAKTGNEAIDVILTKKALLCTEKKIRFNYIVDGQAFSSMNILDITSLFCNIIDNAIEASEKEEGDKRLIKLTAFKKGDFVSLIEENYCTSPVEFSDNGMPISKKEDKSFHGFGNKSTKFIVQKYGGTFSFSQNDGIFRVSVLLPAKKE